MAVGECRIRMGRAAPFPPRNRFEVMQAGAQTRSTVTLSG